MDIREIIRKAKQTAKNPDEVLLPERFEEYLDLLEMRTKATKEELAEIQPRLKKSLAALKEVADRVSISYGMDPSLLIDFFMNQQNVMPGLKQSIQSIQRDMNEPLEAPKKPTRLTKRKNKNLKV